jgi:hypothetical protein
MWFLWEAMHLPPVTAMAAIAQLSQKKKVDSRGFENDQFI